MREIEIDESDPDEVVRSSDDGDIALSASKSDLHISIETTIHTRTELAQIIRVLTQSLEDRQRLGGDINTYPPVEPEEEEERVSVCETCGQDIC